MGAGGDRSRVARLDEREVLADETFIAALHELAEREQREFGEVEKYARECLDELSVRPADRYLGWVASLARFMYTRSFEPQLDVNREALEELRELVKTRPLVFLWSHKSHLDSFVFMRALYDSGFTPQPLSFAGINMAFLGFGALAKHSGAIFLRRTFRDDAVYKLVLQHFIDYLIRQRVPLSWSIEGTRSRTGKLMPPKLGLIQWVVDACERAAREDVLFVPVAISFDQIPEIDDYIAMQRGLPKRKETLKWFIEYIAGMKARYGRIYVRFAEPVALTDSPPVSEALLGADAGEARVRKLAFEICNRIEHAKPITATDLVTLILLAANGRALDEGQIRRQAVDIARQIRIRELPRAGDLDADGPADLRASLDVLTATGLLATFESGSAPVYSIAPGRTLAAAYYRNTIVHYFLDSALAEMALAARGPDSSSASVPDTALGFRDLFKFEFFFRKKDAYRQDVVSYLDDRYPQWRAQAERFPADPPPLFGPGIFRSFVEAYSILAGMLIDRGSRAITAEDESALVKGCLDRGEELLLRRRIGTEAAIAQPLFESALRLAKHRRLLSDDGGGLAIRRKSFAAEVERAQAAVEVLQQSYDKHLDDHADHGPATAPDDVRSIARGQSCAS